MRFLFFLLFCSISSGVFAVSHKIDLSYLLDFYHHDRSDQESGEEQIGIFLASHKIESDKNLFHYSFLINHSSGSPTARIADAQIVSNIDTEGGEGLKVFEAFYEREFSLFKLRLGLIDLSTFINITDSSMELINSSFGTAADFGFAGRFGPAIYPIPSWGAVLMREEKSSYLYAALMDTISEENFDPSNTVTGPRIDRNHHLLLVEAGVVDQGVLKKLGLGLWRFKDKAGQGDPAQQGVFLQTELNFKHVDPFIRLSRSRKFSQKVYQNLVFGAEFKNVGKSGIDLSLGHSQVAKEGSRHQEKVREILLKKKWGLFATSLSFQDIENIGTSENSGHVITLRFDVREGFLL